MSNPTDLSQLQNMDVRVSVEWGRTRITLEEARALGPEAILKVDNEANDPVEVRVQRQVDRARQDGARGRQLRGADDSVRGRRRVSAAAVGRN